MKNRNKLDSGLYSLLCWLLFAVLTGCATGDIDKQIGYGRSLSFRLNIASNEQTKAASAAKLTVRYLLANSNGVLINDMQSAYHPDNGMIVIEPLPLGSYKLFVLGYDQAMIEAGLLINENPTTANETWFSFADQTVPMLSSDVLFYGSKEFVVSSELLENQTVDLSYVLAGVDVEKNIPSLYLRNSIDDIEIMIPESVRFYSGMNVKGIFDGESACSKDNRSLKSKNAFYIMPQTKSDSVQLTFTTTTKDHRGEAYRMNNTVSMLLCSAVKNMVTLDLSAHPDAKSGMLYITKSYYDEEERPLILQDNEPKSIFYDEKQRSFRINELLQTIRNEEGKLQTRFYSPVPIKNVSIWSSDKMYGERILLAYYDSIPAFCNAEFSFADKDVAQEFLTDSKSKIKLTKAEISSLLSSNVEIECFDPYWIKVSKITPTWYIRFSSYGGDPDASNGSPVGNWMGIRPVHIREAVAFMINFGYMISTQDFATYLEGFQGQIWGNGGREDIIDVKQIIPQLNARPGFNMGLVYVGNGVVGLGGGWTLGVSQSTYLNHYDYPNTATTFFHEIGHCLGYSHSSGMSYGPWAEQIANRYYVNNLSSFPVNSWMILNSRNSPNKY